MDIHSLTIFPDTPADFTIRVGETTGTPNIKLGGDINGITVHLLPGESWNWGASALYRLAGQLVQAGQDLAAAAGQAELAEEQSA